MNTFVALCVGAGIPWPTISWAQNGNQLENSSRKTIAEEVTEMDSGITFIQSFLKICSVDPVDAGLYYCIVANRFENDSAYFTLNVTRVGGEWVYVCEKSTTNKICYSDLNCHNVATVLLLKFGMKIIISLELRRIFRG